jgi:hypothetical protein
MREDVLIIFNSVIAQQNLIAFTDKFEEINSINEIETKNKAHYYKLSDFSVDRNKLGSYADINKSSKIGRSSRFDYIYLNFYFTFPILDPSDGNIHKNKCWYGIKFKVIFSGDISEDKFEKSYSTLYKEYLSKMDTFNFHESKYYERIPKSHEKDIYIKSIEARSKKHENSNVIILVPTTEIILQIHNDNIVLNLFLNILLIGFMILIIFIPIYWSSFNLTEYKKQTCKNAAL